MSEIKYIKKKITANLILKWFEFEIPGQVKRSICDDLLSDFGPALPFFIKPNIYNQFPFQRMGIPKISLPNLQPAKGEAWVLFCYPYKSKNLNSPLRSDGFMLPFEWREDKRHSPLIPESLRHLAKKILKFSSSDLSTKYGLHPSHERLGDHIDFIDPSLFGQNIGSAWGALAAGLESARKGFVPYPWPFSSLQLDEQDNKPAAVEGIQQKISVASSFACREFIVAPSQAIEARNALAELIKQDQPGCESIQIIETDPSSSTWDANILYAHLNWLRPAHTPAITHISPFVGREWLINAVLSSDDQNQPEFTVVCGQPGVGKTALLQNITTRLGQSVLTSYTCTSLPALDFVKKLAHAIALRFPQAWQTVDQESIRNLIKNNNNWEQLKQLYQQAVCIPLNNSSPKTIYILIDALDEAPTPDIVKLISDPACKLPDWAHVIVSTRPVQSILQFLNRINIKQINIDADEYQNKCKQDLKEYIIFNLEQPEIVNKLKQSGISSTEVNNILLAYATTHQYIYYTFLNIKNNSYGFSQLENQLPFGVSGHFLAFFENQFPSKKDWQQVRPLLELLIAALAPLPLEIIENSQAKEIFTTRQNIFKGYINIANNCLALSDFSLKEWLADEQTNPDYHINAHNGHQQLAATCWQQFAKAWDNWPEDITDAQAAKNFYAQLPAYTCQYLAYHLSLIDGTGLLQNQKDYQKFESLLLIAREVLAEQQVLIRLAKQRYDLLSQTLGEKDLKTLKALDSYGSLLVENGQYEAGKKQLQKAMQIIESNFKTDLKAHASCLTNLAQCKIHQQGDQQALQEAKPMLEKALKMRRKVLGEEHRETIRSAHNLASLLGRLGLHKKAIKHFKLILKVQMSQFTHDDFDIALTHNNLGMSYRHTGDIKNAENHLRQAHKLFSVTNSRHWRAALNADNLAALLYYTQNELKEADTIYHDLIENVTPNLSQIHPLTTANIFDNYAGLLERQKDFQAAENYLFKALDIRKQHLPQNHPHILFNLNNLGMVYMTSNDPEKALPYFEQAYDACLAQVGAKHPFTKNIKKNLEICSDKG